MSGFMIIAIWSIGFAQKMKKKEDEKENIKQYLEKHITYVFTCIILWISFLSSSYYLLYIDSLQEPLEIRSFDDIDGDATVLRKKIKARIQEAQIGKWIYIANISFSILQGIILMGVRLKEPFYIFKMKREYHSWFGKLFSCDDDDGEISEEEDSNAHLKSNMLSKMNDQLTYDLIYTILYSITNHTVGHKK